MKYFFTVALLLLGVALAGQNIKKVGFNAYSLRMLMVSHQDVEPVDRSLQKSYGMELAFRRQLSKELAIEIPLRAGNADVGEFTNPSFYSGDVMLQYYPLGNDGPVSPAINLGVGAVLETDRPSYQAAPVGLDVNLRLGPAMWLTASAEYRLASRKERNNLVFGLGYTFRTSKIYKDGDGDGVPDVQDLCPEVPGKPSARGCPDADGDGVGDEFDECPSEAGKPNLRGCPDYDKDGVPDHKDQCPYEAGKKILKGCPDIDDDGVPDDIDKCPNTPGGLYNGCPDRDEDGFEDNEDDCPDVPGPNRGCPEVSTAVMEQLDKATNLITFASRDSRLEEGSYPALDEMARMLIANPFYKLTVEGHSDNNGSYESNQKLSELRALSVRGYLMSKGVDGNRISTIGYGDRRPRAENDTAIGRELNRRITFGVTPN